MQSPWNPQQPACHANRLANKRACAAEGPSSNIILHFLSKRLHNPARYPPQDVADVIFKEAEVYAISSGPTGGRYSLWSWSIKHLIERSRCLTYRSNDNGVNYVYDEMPTLRSDGHEGEAPRSVHVRILWLEIDTEDCQQVESPIL